MSAAPTISVALCTFRGERFLPEQLDSILAQTRRPDQVVVCDDGSTDRTRDILTDFARSAPFPVELRFNERNLGVTKNFEQALSQCAGGFAVLTDQDDRWRPDKLAVLSQLLIDNPHSGYACSDAELIDGDGRLLNQRVWPEMRQNPGTLLPQGIDATATRLMQSNFLLGATVMIHLDLLRPWIFPFSTNFYHDHWLVLTSELLGHHGVATPEPLTFYRRHAGQNCGLKRRGVFGALRKLLRSSERRHRQAMRQQRLRDFLAHWETHILPRRPETERWRGALEAAADQFAQAGEKRTWWARQKAA